MCGGVRFEISEPPISASYCHCKHCQRRTGSAASAQARIDPGSLRILKGGELLRSYIPPGGWAKVFCSVCGSSLFSHPPNQSEISSVRLGSFDGDPGVRPAYRQRVGSAAAWEPIPDDGLPRDEGPHPEHEAAFGRPASANPGSRISAPENRGGRIRTGDLTAPNRTRYQASPRPVDREFSSTLRALSPSKPPVELEAECPKPTR